MSKDSLGSGNCYICKRPLAPLVSICWACGYSQLPNPQAQAEAPVEGGGQDRPPPADNSDAAPNMPARDKLRADAQARLNEAKADFKSRLKKT